MHSSPNHTSHLISETNSNFNLPNFVDSAFGGLKASVQLASNVKIGEYATSLDYQQHGVPVATDKSLNYLLPVLARPIVQKIVDASVLG